MGGLSAAIVISAVGLAMVQAMAMGLWGMFDPGVADVGRPLESLGGILIGGLLMVVVIILLSWNAVVTSAQLITSFPRSVLNMISLSEPGLNPYENSMQGIMGAVYEHPADADGIDQQGDHPIPTATAPQGAVLNTALYMSASPPVWTLADRICA